MKLIEQLVEYLHARGALTTQQMKRLAGKGFIAPPEPTPDAGAEHDSLAPGKWAWEELDVESRSARVARKGRRKDRSAGRPPVPEELCARLAQRFPQWQGPLAGLVAVEGHFGPCAGWRQAARRVSKRSARELATALPAVLRDRSQAEAFWTTLDFEGPRDALGGLMGETGNAYAALLRGRPVAEFAKHVWLLRYEEPADVYRLRRAQKMLTQAVRLIYRTTPEAVRRSLRETKRGPLLALLEAARWHHDPLPRLENPAPRFYLLLPGEEAWWPAWSKALAIDPARVTELLQHCQHDPFVAAPPSQVPPELWRFTVGEEAWRAPAADERLLAAIRQVIQPAESTSPAALLAGVGHPYTLVRRQALEQIQRCDLAPLAAAVDTLGAEISLQSAAGVGDRQNTASWAVQNIVAAATEDRRLRLWTLQLLECLGPRIKEGTSALASWIDDPRPEVRSQLAQTLGKLSAAAERSVPFLLALLRDPEENVFCKAFDALVALGTAAAAALPVLLEILDHSDVSKRRNLAAWALGTIPWTSELSRRTKVIPALTQVLEDPDEWIRYRALESLSNFGPSAAPADAVLARLLEDDSALVRLMAIASLERFDRTETFLASLMRILTHEPIRFVLQAASTALAKVPPLALVPHLPELVAACARPDQWPDARRLLAPFDGTAEVIARCLERLEDCRAESERTQQARRQSAAELRQMSAVAARILPRLIDMILTTPQSPARGKALEILEKAGSRSGELAGALVRAIADPDAQVRADAAAAWQEWSSAARDLLPAIWQGLRSENESIRHAAGRLLEWLAPLAVAGLPPAHEATS